MRSRRRYRSSKQVGWPRRVRPGPRVKTDVDSQNMRVKAHNPLSLPERRERTETLDSLGPGQRERKKERNGSFQPISTRTPPNRWTRPSCRSPKLERRGHPGGSGCHQVEFVPQGSRDWNRLLLGQGPKTTQRDSAMEDRILDDSSG